ncbi:MAG TPA: endonuclease/exonuclease/phosphatase family protein [Microcoleaceae cyanobacterium]|jgi:endonuclease/exonuclease/phosphatase (EEP) superfamily protein YafD
MIDKIAWGDRLKGWLPFGFSLCLLLASVCSVTGYLGRWHQLFDLTAHFKLQYCLVGVASLIFFGWRRRSRWKWHWLILSLCCLAINLVEILPWYIPASAIASQPTTPLRLLLFNVKVQNQQYDRAITWVRALHPDIAVFQEVNQSWLDQLDTLQDILPYKAGDSESPRFGNVIYSSLPLHQAKSRRFAQEKFPTLSAEIRPVDDRKAVTLFATHPSPPLKPADFVARNQQFIVMATEIQRVQQPVITIGDLNTTMWSPNYQDFMQRSGLRNSRLGFGLLPSWPTYLPLLRIPIDHCLVSPEITVIRTQTGQNIGSDHLPLIIDVALPAPGTDKSNL